MQPVRTRLKEPACEKAAKKAPKKAPKKARDRRNPGAPTVSRVRAYATDPRAVKPDQRVLSLFVDVIWVYLICRNIRIV